LGTSGWTVYAQRNSVSTTPTQAEVKLKTTKGVKLHQRIEIPILGISRAWRETHALFETSALGQLTPEDQKRPRALTLPAPESAQSKTSAERNLYVLTHNHFSSAPDFADFD